MYLLDKLNELKTKYSSIKTEVKLLPLLAGFLYLNSYLREFGIAFPMDISSLVSILTMIGILSISFIVISLVYCLLTSLIINPMVKNGSVLSKGLKSKNKNKQWIHVLIAYTTPLCLTIEYMYFVTDTKNYYFFIAIFLANILWAIVYIYTLKEMTFEKLFKKQSNKYIYFNVIAKSCAFFIAIQFVSYLSISMFVVIFFTRIKDIGSTEAIIYILAYVVVNSLVVFATIDDETNDTHETNNSIIQHNRFDRMLIITLSFFVLSLHPSVSQFPAEIALRYLNIGGGINFRAKDVKDNCEAWPEFIKDNVNEKDGSCVSKNGKLIIQIGERYFVEFEADNKSPAVVNLKLSDASIVSDMPKSSYYK